MAISCFLLSYGDRITSASSQTRAGGLQQGNYEYSQGGSSCSLALEVFGTVRKAHRWGCSSGTIGLYHSRDDDLVPFGHLALYARAPPQATVRELDGYKREFKKECRELFLDIEAS
jgi:hypothetical protein